MHWFFLALELVMVSVAVVKTRIPRNEIELSTKAMQQLREMEDRQIMVRARARKESK